MHDTPIADALFSTLLTNDHARLDAISSERAAECMAIRAVFSTQDAGAIDLDLGLGVSSSEYVTCFFEGPRVFLLSPGTSLQAHLSGGQSHPSVDYSLSLDSNIAEKVRAAVCGEDIQPADRQRVNDILMLKARKRAVQFDLFPFLMENTRLTRGKPDNQRPLNTLIAFRMLDHLDWDAFQGNPNELRFKVPRDVLKASVRASADDYLSELQRLPEVVHFEAKSVAMQALLLRFARLWHEHKKPDKKRILRNLVRFSIDELGAIPITELRLIWSGMTSNLASPFFGPITGRAKDMPKDVRGMAWDMTLLRVLEQLSTSNRFDAFYIPYFVSMDARWRKLMRLNLVTFMLSDHVNRRVLFARTGELDFQGVLGGCMQSDFQADMTPEKIEARRRAAKGLQLDVVTRVAAREEEGWMQALPTP